MTQISARCAKGAGTSAARGLRVIEGRYCADQPPYEARIAPLMFTASSLSRNVIDVAT